MKYITNFVCNCPNNNTFDKYKVIIKSEKMIQVEEINDYLKCFQKQKAYQEDLTVEISKYFKCEVKIIGVHQGVKIVSKNYG